MPDVGYSAGHEVSARLAVTARRVSRGAVLVLGVCLLMGGVVGDGQHGIVLAATPPCAMHDAETAARTEDEAETNGTPDAPDVSGIWEIREEKRTYTATLDARGNGPYTHQNGSFTTTELIGRTWSGTWKQTGNDREGGFAVRLSEDGLTAEGSWWYTRVGLSTDIPPCLYGGSYVFKRLGPAVDGHDQP